MFEITNITRLINNVKKDDDEEDDDEEDTLKKNKSDCLLNNDFSIVEFFSEDKKDYKQTKLTTDTTSDIVC